MRRTTMLNRAASVVLSTTLACSLSPVVAFAANDDVLSADDVAASDIDIASSDSSAASTVAPIADVPASVEANHDQAAESNVPNNQITATPTDALQIVRAAVPVAEASQAGEAQAIFTWDGLNYRVDEANGTAVLVGISQAPEGDLTIPSRVVSGGQAYAVTAIESGMNLRGGGRLLHRNLKMMHLRMML